MVVNGAGREGSCLMGGGRPRRALKSGWGAVRAVAASVAVVREV